jgi:hypothetical protein
VEIAITRLLVAANRIAGVVRDRGNSMFCFLFELQAGNTVHKAIRRNQAQFAAHVNTASNPRTFHAELFDRRGQGIRIAIADSKARGFQHLDQIPFYVETMRGVHFHSIRDGSSGTVTTVGSDGLIRVRWDDLASAERNCADVDNDFVVTLAILPNSLWMGNVLFAWITSGGATGSRLANQSDNRVTPATLY